MASDGTIKITTELDNSKAEQAMSKLGKIFKAGIATLGIAKIGSEIMQLGGYVLQTGIQFESAFAGVEKTVDATDAEIQQFRSGIRDMAKEIPQTAAEISSVAEAAGQLGIQNEYILGFSRTMSDLGVATNMSATEAATSLARLANITQMPQENFDRLGSTIVALGNNLATTEAEITEMTLRLAGAGNQVGMTEAEIMGLAGAISSVGIEADAGGSAISTVVTKMQLAVEQGGESLEQFANVAGMSATEFQQAFRENAAQALVAFVEGLGNMESRGQSAIATLADMEITEIRQRDALLRLAGAGDVLSESLGIATQAWDENNALTNEAEKRYQTLESQIQILKNNVDDFAISLYDGIRDPMAEVVSDSIGYVQRLQSAFETGGISATAAELGEVFDDVTDDIAGTSKAAAGLVTPLKNVATTGANLAGGILPVIGAGAKILAENFDAALPVVVGVTAGMKAYSAISKATATATKANAAATAALTTMEKANALQLVATNGGLTLRQTLLAVYNGQITATTALTGLWTKAQTALNTAMNANPIGAAVAGTAALLAVGTALKAVKNRQTEAEREHSQALRDNVEAAKENLEAAQERKRSYEEFVQTQNEQAAGDVAQMDRLRQLNNELNTIVDANGRVKAGEEDRAAFITSQLSSALGLEISMTDGVIGNYQELQGQIQSLIEQKRIEAVMTAQQAKYEEAVANQMQAASEASAAYTAMKQAENDVKRESAELDSLEEEHRQAVIDGNKALVSTLEEKIKKQQEDVDSAQEAYEKNKEAYSENTELLAQYANDIDMYTTLAEAAASGNAEAIEQAISQITAGIKTASSATAEELQQQVVDVANMENLIRQEVEKGTPGFTQAMLTQAQSATTSALEEFAKVAPQTAAELAKVPPEAVAALVEADLEGQLSSEASGAVQGMCSAMRGMSEESRNAILELLQPVLSETQMASLQMMINGQNAGISYAAGVSSTADQASAAGSSINASADSGAGSGDFYSTGAASGLQYASGVSGQSGTARGAGSTLASSADSGAGSKNPSGTGGKFGSQYASGVGSKSGEARNQGVLLGSSAEGGASTADGTSSGSNFGAGFVSGIGKWLGRAASAAAGLAMSAYNALRNALSEKSPSRKTKNSGKNFDLGFGIGIDENADVPVKSVEDMTARTLDALDPDALQAKLQELDIPETMSKVYFAVDDKKSRVAENMISAVKAQEDLAWKERERNQTVQLADADLEKLAKVLEKAARRPFVVQSFINGRQAAAAMVDPMQDQLNRKDKINKMVWKGEKS